MFYQMHEGYLTLNGPWHDQSVNVFVPQYLEVKGANLVVARDTLPEGMEFPDYVNQQKNLFKQQLPEFKLIDAEEGVIDNQPAYYLEFTWINHGTSLCQIMGVTHIRERIVSLTASIPGEMNPSTREQLLNVMKSFKFGAMPVEPEGGPPT